MKFQLLKGPERNKRIGDPVSSKHWCLPEDLAIALIFLTFSHIEKIGCIRVVKLPVNGGFLVQRSNFFTC